MVGPSSISISNCQITWKRKKEKLFQNHSLLCPLLGIPAVDCNFSCFLGVKSAKVIRDLFCAHASWRGKPPRQFWLPLSFPHVPIIFLFMMIMSPYRRSCARWKPNVTLKRPELHQILFIKDNSDWILKKQAVWMEFNLANSRKKIIFLRCGNLQYYCLPDVQCLQAVEIKNFLELAAVDFVMLISHYVTNSRLSTWLEIFHGLFLITQH